MHIHYNSEKKADFKFMAVSKNSYTGTDGNSNDGSNWKICFSFGITHFSEPINCSVIEFSDGSTQVLTNNGILL